MTNKPNFFSVGIISIEERQAGVNGSNGGGAVQTSVAGQPGRAAKPTAAPAEIIGRTGYPLYPTN